jgi:hypothetical protein
LVWKSGCWSSIYPCLYVYMCLWLMPEQWDGFCSYSGVYLSWVSAWWIWAF